MVSNMSFIALPSRPKLFRSMPDIAGITGIASPFTSSEKTGLLSFIERIIFNIFSVFRVTFIPYSEAAFLTFLGVGGPMPLRHLIRCCTLRWVFLSYLLPVKKSLAQEMGSVLQAI